MASWHRKAICAFVAKIRAGARCANIFRMTQNDCARANCGSYEKSDRLTAFLFPERHPPPGGMQASQPPFGRIGFFELDAGVLDNEFQGFAIGVVTVLLDRNHTKLFRDQGICGFESIYF